MKGKILQVSLAVLLMVVLTLPGCVPKTELEECQAQLEESQIELNKKDVTIEEKDAQINEQAVTIGELRSKADFRVLEDPTYDELMEFLDTDNTDKLRYPGHDDYAKIFLENAAIHGIKGHLVTTLITAAQTWFFTGFETTNRGWIYIMKA